MSKQQRWVNLIVQLVCLSLLFALASCCKPPPPPPSTPEEYIRLLTNQGVDVIKTGETYQIVIPTTAIYNPDSANFNSHARKDVLQPLLGLLSFYETTSMEINGYTDNSGTVRRQCALSERQAQVLAAFLAEHGVDARLIYALGFGPLDPIASNETPEGRAKNNRIEINFRYVVLPYK